MLLNRPKVSIAAKSAGGIMNGPFFLALEKIYEIFFNFSKIRCM